MNIPERVEENKSPVESKALPHENVIFRCWSPDCRKVATCRDGSGWDWCDDHIDQEKTGSVLHTAQAYYNVDFYKERVRIALTETDQQAREETQAVAQNAYSVLSYLYYRGYISYEKKGCPTKEEIDEKLKYFSKALSNPPSQV